MIPGSRLPAEKILEQFEAAWRKGTPPRIESFLPPRPEPLRKVVLEDLVALDLEYRWRHTGERPRLEDYVVRFPDLGPLDQLSLELITEEYRIRQRFGDRPGHADYAARFPRQGPALLKALRKLDAELHEEHGTRTGDSTYDTQVPYALPVAPITVAGVVEQILQLPLLSPSLHGELKKLQARCKEPRDLAKELLQRNWLTPYQVNLLMQGRGAELVLGTYLILERLGEGGTGWVYKARHLHMNRLVCIKVLRRELLADAEVMGRFYREIQVISRLSHPHVVHAFDAGPIKGAHVLVMEYADGIDLLRLLKQGPLPVEQAVEYIRQAALGLQHIHEQGLVHRDVKPSNLLLTKAHGAQSVGVIKMLDLGLARLGQIGAEGGVLQKDGSSGRLTPRGAMVVGTPDYLAPEQAMDFRAADIRADIYSLGCTFYHLLAGQPPFAGGTMIGKLMRHQQAEPPPISKVRKDLPAWLDPVLRTMLAKDPADRYQTPAEVVDALTRHDRRVPARPALLSPGQRWRWGVLAAVLLLSLGLAGWFVFRSTSDAKPVGPAPIRIVPQPVAIATLRSTGIGTDGQPLGDGAVDPHWTIRATPAGPTTASLYATVNRWPVGEAWLANSNTSRWISPQADEKVGDPAGTYTFATTFDLTSFDSRSVRLNLRLAVDNVVTDVKLNGQSLGLNAKGFDAWSTLTINHGFRPGINSLELIVLNEPLAPINPCGLRVELSGTAIPAPTLWFRLD